MIINLFSVFDPTSYFYVSLNWIIVFFLIIIPIKYYIISRGIFLLFDIIYLSVRNVFKEISYPKHLGLSFLCIVVFLYLIIINFLRLFPFVFTVTAQPLFTLGVGLILWLSFFIIGWFHEFMKRAAHLVPEGSPIFLAPLIVIIERVSHFIRPFTLSVRLAANIIAGHLIIGLISIIRVLNIYNFYVSILIQNILILLEFGVAVIQGFVFRILLLLYALEYY